MQRRVRIEAVIGWMVVIGSGCARPVVTTRCPEPAAAAASVQASCEAAPVKAATNAAAVVDEVVALINEEDAAGLHARFAPEMAAAIPVDALATMLGSMLGQRGKLTGARPIAAGEREGAFEVTAARGAWKLQIALAADDRIAGLRLGEPDSSAPALERSAPAGLPFRGEWSVVWGGDTAALNHHVGMPSQRRAADLVKVDKDGKTHRGSGQDVKDYYAYGQDILAMADGVVVTAVDGVPDSVPGELNAYFVPGNLVILQHPGGVHSAYAHLIPGSLKVKVGQKVRRGQVLGACGNSGNSSEPHLHVQFQDGPRFDRSWGIEAVFDEVNVVRGGTAEVRSGYSFLKGDVVGPVGAKK